jgi:Protein of unknown function (DUF1475)
LPPGRIQYAKIVFESIAAVAAYLSPSLRDVAMTLRRNLSVLFTLILLSMICVTSWASWVQPVWQWTGLKQQPNHAWTIATLFDAYFGFITFYTWVLYKEPGTVKRLLWFIAIMLLGNMAMAAYMLKELRRLHPDDPMSQLLVRRNG